MVNTSISQNHEAPPEASSNATQLTINHAATADAESHPFEGVEKLLEVDFGISSTPGTLHPLGLRSLAFETWVEVLEIAKCSILSVIKSSHVDAYVLSESSLFVFASKIILKTCGTTLCLTSLPRILELALGVGFPSVGDGATFATPYRVFYSRRNFLFPNLQLGPHVSWTKEIELLQTLCPGGSAYLIGNMNASHWYLYVSEPNALLTPPPSPAKDGVIPIQTQASYRSKSFEDDCTIEITMTGLDPALARQYYLDYVRQAAKNQISSSDQSAGMAESSEGHMLGSFVARSSGLADIYPAADFPDARIDAFLFEPCGLSANGVIPAAGDGTSHYFTVHVTPEDSFSYASFETNFPRKQTGRETEDLVSQVVDIFRPRSFLTTVFDTDGGSISVSGLNVKGYKRVECSLHQLEEYTLLYNLFQAI